MALSRYKIAVFLKKIRLHRLAKSAFHSPFGIFVRKILRHVLAPFLGREDGTLEGRKYVSYCRDLPVEENTILYESFHGSSVSCSPYAIYKHLKRQPNYAHFVHIWVKNSGLPIPPSISQENIRFVDRNSDEYIRYLAITEILVNNSTFPPFFTLRTEQKYLNTWHGVPLKKMFMDEGAPTVHANSAKNFLQATHIMLPNRYTAKRLFESSGVAGILSAKVLENCSPRSELTTSADADEIKKSLGFNINQKVVLYAPTWRGALGNVIDESEATSQAIRVIKQALPSYQLVVSIHNMAKLEELDLDDVTILDGSIEINELLSCVDILVSDYSSIIFDFLSLQRPIVLYAYDLEEYARERGFYFELEELPATLARSRVELSAALKSIFKEPDTSGPETIMDVESPCFLGHDTLKYQQAIDDILQEPAGGPGCYNNGKKNVVAFLGGLKSNGISTSAVNLSTNFDFENYNLIVLTAGREIDRDEDKQRTLAKIDRRCNIVHRVGRLNATVLENDVLDGFYSTNEIDDTSTGILQKLFQNEQHRMLGRIKIDVAIDFSGYARYWSLLMGFCDARKKIIYQHNDMLSEAQSRFDILFGVFSCYQFFDKIVAVSEPTMKLNQSRLSGLYPGISDKFDFVPNCIVPEDIVSSSQLDIRDSLKREKPEPAGDINAVVPENEQTPLPDSANINFVNMGRFSPEKDQQKLIRAFSRIAVENHNARLYLIGSGPMEEELCLLVEELGLTNKVIFTGQLVNPFPLLAACDAFVLSSNYEGQPMVLLEALVLNVQVIATDIVGSRSVLGDRYGQLVENSIGGLVDGMNQILSKRCSNERFDAAAYVKNTNAIFREKVLH